MRFTRDPIQVAKRHLSSTCHSSRTVQHLDDPVELLRIPVEQAANLKSLGHFRLHLRVDGHTDDTPLLGGRYADNWELSQGRALSVVKYMISALGIPPDRLAANGFGQYQPVAPGESEEARAQNRRIELKFTER